MKVLGFLNKKGGAGKTTTALGVACGLSARGQRVGLDTDPNGSASRWMETVEGLHMVPCAAADLQPLLDGVRHDYDVVLIDSPSNDAQPIAEIAAVSDAVLLPLAPSVIEVDQLPDTVDQILPAGRPWYVVPVRVRMSTSAGRTIRRLCKDQGVPVTRSIVPLSEPIAKSFGEELPRLSFTSLVDELLETLELMPV